LKTVKAQTSELVNSKAVT